MKKFFIVLSVFFFTVSIITAITIQKNVRYYNDTKYQLNIQFSKNITNYNLSVNKKSLNIYLNEKIFGNKNLNFFLPINVKKNRISIKLSSKISRYKIKKYKNIFNISLYKFSHINTNGSKRKPKKENPDVKKDSNNEKNKKLKKKIIDKTNFNLDKNIKKNDKWIVFIDPGHGGKDPGAMGPDGTKEKEVVLSVAKKINSFLKKEKNIKVYLTRDDDRFIFLSKRAEMANNKKADLFVSIHANAIAGWRKRKRTKGVETYFLAEASSDRAREVAIKENEALKYEMKNYKNMNTIEGILLDMADMQYKKESSKLAYAIQKKLIDTTHSVDRGVQQALFYVLRFVSMPSVLIEIGFISHPKEEDLLTSKDYQTKIAKNISEGIKDYFEKRREIGRR